MRKRLRKQYIQSLQRVVLYSDSKTYANITAGHAAQIVAT